MYTIKPPEMPGVVIQCDHPEEVLQVVDLLVKNRDEAAARRNEGRLGFGFVGVGGDHWERPS